jgi:fumarate hydratase class II
LYLRFCSFIKIVEKGVGMKYRKERDSLGEVEVSVDRYFGAQTMRSKQNFLIGSERMPLAVVHALAIIKKAAATVNHELGLLPLEKKQLIGQVCDEILSGILDDHFPLLVWQTGSGTQTNMNVNEVISNRAIEKIGGKLGSKEPIHPNDDVNMSQSSNDLFPTAMHIAAMLMIQNRLMPNLKVLKDSFASKALLFAEIIKVGRTHLMDAAPLTLGQEFSGYVSQLDHVMRDINHALALLSELAIGGTAVGTGLNAPPSFAKRMCEEISKMTGIPFGEAPNKFAALAANDAVVATSGALRGVAVALLKIVNDIRWMASGPRCGLAELLLPANEPGSSIMPGKVNPTQCEALSMVCLQVMGNDATIGFAGSQGNFELNVYRPLMIYNLLQSIRLLADGVLSFNNKCLIGIEANRAQLRRYVEHSLQLATALNQVMGYDKASQIVRKAQLENLSLKEAALAVGGITEEEFLRIVDPVKMVHPHKEVQE